MSKDLQSYKTLKSYLDSIDVDTSNMDNDTLDSQYLQRLRKRNGEALNTREQREGNITLTQYLSDAQALQDKNKAIAQAENDARQETAYNDYVNSKLAKYLNIAEENNGTAGYTGITEGNRIALANQEKNIASNIQNTKQNAISDYLRDYNNALMDNSKYALDEMTTMQSTFDQIERDKQDNEDYKKELARDNIISRARDYMIPNIIDNIQKYSDGTLYISETKKLLDYINSLNISDEDKQTLLNEINAEYNFSDGTNVSTLSLTPQAQQPQNTENPDMPPKNPDNPPTTSNNKILNKDGTESNFYQQVVDANGKSKVINFTLDGENYQTRLSSGISTISGIKSYYNQTLDVGKAEQYLSNLKVGEGVAFYKNEGKTPTRYVILKIGDNKYSVIEKSALMNTPNEANKTGFLKLYKYFENKGLVLNDLLNK